MTTLSIWLCKIITAILHWTGRDGSVYPGSIIYKFNKKALWKLKYPKYVIAVTGSSGKGSTVSMIAHILSATGKKVIWNQNGSNISNAIMTLMLDNCRSFSHRIDADIVLLEIDERHLKEVFRPGTITHLVITNVTRDQPARNIHPEIIFETIMHNIGPDVEVIINADDPILNRVKISHMGKIITYGIAQNRYSLKTTPPYAIDAAYCPKCHTKLKYETYHYGHLGIYACPNCNFERGNVDYEASDIDLEKQLFKINGRDFKLNKNVFFAVYYTLAAYTLTKSVGIDEEIIEREINEDVLPSKRMKIYELDGRRVEMIESKNENALSYLQSLNYIRGQKGQKTVVMGFENVSRRYRFNDLSWLWDVDFELLKDDSIATIFCIGRFKYDVATRLDYAGIPKEKIVLVEDIQNLIEDIRNKSEGDIYTMVCFDMTGIITGLLKEANSEKEN